MESIPVQPTQPASIARSPFPYPLRPSDPSSGRDPQGRTSLWAAQNGKRAVTKSDLASQAQSIAVTGDVRDGIAGALVDASNDMEPVDDRQINPMRHEALRRRMDFWIGWTQDPSIGYSGRSQKDHGAGPGAFSLPEPDIISHKTGQSTWDADASAALAWDRNGSSKATFGTKLVRRPVGKNMDSARHPYLASDWIEQSVRAALETQGAKPHQTSPWASGKPAVVRMSKMRDPCDTVDEALAFQTGRMRADAEILPANSGMLRPNGRIDRGSNVTNAGIPSSADLDHGLRHLPAAIHTVPELLLRDAAAQGVRDPMSVARQERIPHTDRWGFRFADKASTDFSKPKFYPARDGSDKLLYEKAAQFAPDLQADIADRMMVMSADRIPEPIGVRLEMMRDMAMEMTHERDPYLRPRTGPSVTKPGTMAKPPSWFIPPGETYTPKSRFGGAPVGGIRYG